MLFDKFEKLWKVWLFVPFVLLIVSVIILFNNIASTGFFIGRDVELIGGNRIVMELEGPVDIKELQNAMPYASFQVITGLRHELLVETSPSIDVNKVLDDLAGVGLSGNYDLKTVGPALGDIFWQQAQLAIIVAFLFMSVVVFILFRNPVPSGIVIFSVVTDVVVTVAVMDLIGVKLSLPVLAALLMIIGYSVDTDILLTSEMLKARGREISESIKSAMKTGLTMSLTTLAALTALFLVSGIFVLEQIAIVLIIGIVVDVFVTWMGNANILRFWLIKHENS